MTVDEGLLLLERLDKLRSFPGRYGYDAWHHDYFFRPPFHFVAFDQEDYKGNAMDGHKWVTIHRTRGLKFIDKDKRPIVSFSDQEELEKFISWLREVGEVVFPTTTPEDKTNGT